jgi:dipeptidase E
MRLLLLSSSRQGETGYLQHAKPAIREFLGGAVRRVLFLPYARVIGEYDAYVEQVGAVFDDLGYNLHGIHRVENPIRAIEQAEALAVGGGNTWQLAREVHRLMLTEPIRRRVRAGTPYLGWSAGSNLACPTFQTTNDMPICEPLGLDALGLIPFQINPHYLHGNPPGFHGETREERIIEYLELHPDVWAVGLREGTMLRIEDGSIRLIGDQPCRVFRRGHEFRELGPDASFEFLLSDHGTC